MQKPSSRPRRPLSTLPNFWGAFRLPCSYAICKRSTEIGAEQNSTIVFPMPIDIMKPFLEILDKAGDAANGAAHVTPKDVPLLA